MTNETKVNIEFDCPHAVSDLRAIAGRLDGWEDGSNDLMDELDWLMAQVDVLSIPQDVREDFCSAYESTKQKLIAVHNSTNEAASWAYELLDKLRSLPMGDEPEQ